MIGILSHFKVREADEAKGVIRAERDVDVWSWGEWVGIFITPRAAGASSYDLEVVSRKKLMGQLTGQNWEKKIIEQVLFALCNPEKPLP